MTHITNKFVLCPRLIKGGVEIAPAEIVPLISTSDTARGNGVLVSRGKRALPGATASTLLFAFFARAGAHCVAVGHGVRLMLGSLSPAFFEARGMTDGTLYVYGGSAKRGALETRLEAAGITGTQWRIEGKGGAYITLPAGLTEGQASSVWDVLSGADFASVGGGNGYVSDPRLGLECEGVTLEAAAPVVQEGGGDATDKPKGKAGRPKSSVAKRKEAVAE